MFKMMCSFSWNIRLLPLVLIASQKQGMLFSIVSCFSNTWFCCVWSGWMLIGWVAVCVWKAHILIASVACGICCVYKSCILIASVACGIVVMHSHWMSALLFQQVAGFFVVPAFWLAEWFAVVWRRRRPPCLKWSEIVL